jgi:hypothetical protein
MKIQNSNSWVVHALPQQLMGTLGITLAAFALRSAIHPLIQPYGVFHFFIVGVLIVQYLFGYRMALLSVLISLALGEIYFIEPYGQVSNLTDKDLIISLNFVLVILPAIFLMENLQRTLYGRQLLNKVNDSRMLVALRRENDRLYFSKKIDQSNDFIQTLLAHFDRLLWIKTHHHPVMPGPALYRVCRMEPGGHAWTDLFSDQDLAEIKRPLSAPDWSSRRGERDFQMNFKHPDGSKILKGKVISYQLPDHQIELWLSLPD